MPGPTPDEPIDAEIVETTPPVVPSPDYTADGVPTFDFVRDRIESRYATSLGSTELASETTEARTLEEREAERARAAQARLDEIRRSMGSG
ncbi:MAG TPA: hypothetical protein VGD67_16820 [Pseudonocardiaceae bacterium]